jgi:hypothetical protein
LEVALKFPPSPQGAESKLNTFQVPLVALMVELTAMLVIKRIPPLLLQLVKANPVSLAPELNCMVESWAITPETLIHRNKKVNRFFIYYNLLKFKYFYENKIYIRKIKKVSPDLLTSSPGQSPASPGTCCEFVQNPASPFTPLAQPGSQSGFTRELNPGR